MNLQYITDEVKVFLKWMRGSTDPARCWLFGDGFLRGLLINPEVDDSTKKLVDKYFASKYLGWGWEMPDTTVSKRRSLPGYVYLLSLDIGAFKIGKAIDITKRVKSLGVKIPIQVTLIHSFRSDDYSLAELTLHEKFASKRTVGEWFELDEEDVEYIKSIQDGQL